MNSEHIKSAVSKIKVIKSTGDLQFKLDESKAVGNNLLNDLVTHFSKAPLFVSAIYQYMMDEGIDITGLQGESLEKFSDLYGSKINQLNNAQRQSLKKISNKLFMNN